MVSSICRMCLATKVRMHFISGTPLQALFEKNLDTPLHTTDMRPVVACYICYALLDKFHKFMLTCANADDILTAVVDKFKQITKECVSLIDRKAHGLGASLVITVAECIDSRPPGPRPVQVKSEEELRQVHDEIKTVETTDTQPTEQSIFAVPYQPRNEAVPLQPDPDSTNTSLHQPSDGNVPLNNPKKNTVIICQDIRMPNKNSILERLLEGRRVESAPQVERNVQEGVPTPKFVAVNQTYSENVTVSELQEPKKETGGEPTPAFVTVDLTDAQAGPSVTPSDPQTTTKHTGGEPAPAFVTVDLTDAQAGPSVTPSDTQATTKNTDGTLWSTQESATPKEKDAAEKNTISKQVEPTKRKKNIMNRNWNCDVCSIQFSKKRDLQHHSRSHYPYECNVCHDRFPTETDLNIHISIHFGDKRKTRRWPPYDKINKINVCTVCQRPFHGKIRNFLDHFRTHTGVRPYSCDFCERKFISPSNLKVHLRYHTGERPYECNICHKTYRTSEECLLHVRTHSEERPFECHICHGRYKGMHELKTHLRIHTAAKTHECNICHSKFRTKFTLAQHFVRHTEEKPFECNICQRGFKKKKYLESHKLSHLGSKLYECDICQKRYNQKHNMIVHLRSHTERYECTVCRRAFSYKGSYSNHIKIHGEKTFACNICDKRFYQKFTLNTHMQAKHIGKLHECVVCQRRFVDKNHLNTHLISHTGEKKFECEICHYKFGLKHHLQAHMRTHTGDKIYFECDHCHRRLSRKSTLQTHLKTHTSVKPSECKVRARVRTRTADKYYECDHCHKQYKRKYTLQIHIKTHTH